MELVKKIGNRIYLRPLVIDDASQKYCDWLNDPEVNIYLETRKSTVEDLKSYIKQKLNDTNSCLLGIFDKANDKHIGNVKLEIINQIKKRADFGIILGDKSYWGQGIGTEATKLAVDYAFNELSLDEVELGVLDQNKRGQKAFAKAGFKITEVKKNFTNHDGTIYDAVMMEIKK
ncbi:GNAT family N-acetyltransferase [Candidatus Falkowbacteria bacterium]|nr:GNAT family N-acetyltransferase [Candidatus Falkowbacteria bacterium]